MKAKKLLPILATLLAVGPLGLSACAGNTKIVFGNYWDTNYDPATHSNINETLTYDVSFDAGTSSLVDYKVSYAGEYVTNLRSELYEGHRAYVFTTSMTLNVTFDLDGDFETKEDQYTPEQPDSITSEVRFYASQNGLKPISSKKTTVSHTPLNRSVKNAEDCFELYSYHTETTYNEDCSGKSFIDKNYDPAKEVVFEQEPSFKKPDPDYNALDNEQLLAAIRAVPSTTSSATVLAYNPYDGANKIKLSFSNKDAEPFTFEFNGESKERNVAYRSVSVEVDHKNSGSGKTVYVARTEDSANNTYRNIVLYLTTPLAYGLGTLEYSLVSAVYA